MRTGSPPMAGPKEKKAFLEGYEEGLKAAWNEVAKLGSRGYSSTELGMLAKTRLTVIHRDVEAMAAKIDAAPGEVPGEGEITARGSYLVNEEKGEAVYASFRVLLGAGARGLAITRGHPADLAKRFRLGEIESIWLSRTPDKAGAEGIAVADPTDLVGIAGAVIKFLEAGGGAAVVLDGLEYLVSLNGFPSVLRFIQTLNEKVLLNDSYLLISANAAAIKEQEYRVLAREMAGEL